MSTRFKPKDNEIVVTEDVVLHASAAETATVNTAGVDIGNKGTYRGHLAITAVAGTSPTLTVTIQTSHDNGVTDAWRTAGAAMVQQTGVVDVRQTFHGCDRFIRANCVIGGSAGQSVTFVVEGEVV